MFCYARPTTWNALPDLKKNSTLSLSTFTMPAETFLLLTVLAHQVRSSLFYI